MKLFYKKDYLKEAEKNILLLAAIDNREKIIKELEIKNKNYENKIDELTSENYDLHKKIKQEQGAKGGLTKNNNKLKKEVVELQKEVENLKAKLEESMTDKYLVKKIPSGKTPNTIKTKVSSPMKASVRKYMKEEFE